jgi:hypothetical protein
MKKAYFVKNFPVNKITQTGEDGWCHKPNHVKNKYGWLDAILELIDNTKTIDPVQIIIHHEKDIKSGPSGANRLFALMTKRQITHVPAIVSTDKLYDWFGDEFEEINTKEDILKYFRPEHLPEEYFLEDGIAFWRTKNVYDPEKIIKNMKVSDETKNRLLKMIEEESK